MLSSAYVSRSYNFAPEFSADCGSMGVKARRCALPPGGTGRTMNDEPSGKGRRFRVGVRRVPRGEDVGHGAMGITGGGARTHRP